MNLNVNCFSLYLLILFSCKSFGSESYLFPVSTQINRANLYDYSINVSLSNEYIVLQYDDDKELFYDGSFLSYVTTTIPTTSGDSFEYNYRISDFNSSCSENGSGTVVINDFVDLYIDKVHYPDIENIPNFEFDADNNSGFERATNEFLLVTNQTIPSDEPLSCNGNITFNVELKL
ncbi:conserved hypothetical protein [Vibrio chagasii]|nr:conserved hypothetical protein [Vibrio chagasii]CAH7063596.1 conserved hypothetical protein [Vibrio chagasii]CAH7079858.1 conserved hypothetical protein [Vibrio chagasii]CAH7196898.1 conserved hypothetical protein [Vibrio chagasii]CAH7221342.1 conserved hypothetical protein [Vibrio chagasii]